MRPLLLLLVACGDNAHPRVLFVRGAPGTGGPDAAASDEQLADITDDSTAPGNHGYAQLANLLRGDGFEVDQVIEPIELATVGLDRHEVVFFASNNATYTPDDAALVRHFVEAGGGALFASDTYWGPTWAAGAASDQAFLTQFGLVMNQDAGAGTVTTIVPANYAVPTHPILTGVDAFEGEGVSPCTLTHDPAARGTATRVVAMVGDVRRPVGLMGPVTPATDDDAALATVEDRGRVACTFDRNTFFDDNGAGTSLAQASNTRYALNLFDWLAGRF